jgi:hypothetical protein
MPDVIACPAPARIVDRWTWASSDGLVEHVKTGCANHHWLTPLAQTLASAQSNPTPAATQPAPA